MLRLIELFLPLLIEYLIKVTIHYTHHVYRKITGPKNCIIKIHWTYLQTGHKYDSISSHKVPVHYGDVILTSKISNDFLKQHDIDASDVINIKLDHRINHIAPKAFKTFISLKSIELPTNLKIIGSYAFYGCLSLSGTVTLPDTLICIGYKAFYGCDLTKIIIPNHLISITSILYAYQDRISISEYEDIYSYKNHEFDCMIGPQSFDKNYHLNKVVIKFNDDLSDIDWAISDDAFLTCHKIKNISLFYKNECLNILNFENIIAYFSHLSFAQIYILISKFTHPPLSIPNIFISLQKQTVLCEPLPYILAEYLNFSDYIKLDPKIVMTESSMRPTICVKPSR